MVLEENKIFTRSFKYQKADETWDIVLVQSDYKSSPVAANIDIWFAEHKYGLFDYAYGFCVDKRVVSIMNDECADKILSDLLLLIDTYISSYRNLYMDE